MIKRRRAYRRTHGEVPFPACLPAQDDLEAVYLGKILPTFAGVITNELDTAGDAQLVDSNCLNVITGTYAVAGTDSIHDATSVDGCMIFNVDAILGNQALIAKYDTLAGTKLELLVSIDASGRFVIVVYDTSGNAGLIRSAPGAIVAGIWNSVFFTVNGNNATITINGVETPYVIAAPYTGLIVDTTAPLSVAAWNAGASYAFAGKIAVAQLGYAKFNCASGGKSLTLHNTGTAGGDATITGFTLPVWDLQDVYHYNFLNGFDLWENGTLGEEIRVPIGATVLEAGYTFTSSNPSGIWHNNAESKIDLDPTLKGVVDLDVPDPLSYPFESNFGGAFTTFSNTEENKHKYLTFYVTARINNEELEEIQKCLKMVDGELVLGTEELVVLTTEEGLILEGE